MKSPCSKMRNTTKQRGVILLIVAAVLVLAGLSMLLAMFDDTTVEAKRNQKTAEALAQAKEALIGRAVSNDNRPGSLPCPDLITNISGNVPNDGVADLFSGKICQSYIGRLPWRTLGLPDLRDGHGERLWYALSPNFTDSDKLSNGTTPPVRIINSDTLGQLVVTGASPANDVVAIIFAPGPALVLVNQQRDSANPASAISNTVANFLEAENAAGGAIYSEAFLRGGTPTADDVTNVTYTSAVVNIAVSTTFNDKLLAITRSDLMPLMEKRVVQEARICLDSHALNNGQRYPWAVPVTTPTTPLSGMVSAPNTFFGRFQRDLVGLMFALFDDMVAAIDAYEASRTSANYDAKQAAYSAAQISANDVKNYYSDLNNIPLKDAAANMEVAANNVSNLNASSTATDFTNMRQALADARTAFSNLLPATNCTLFSSSYWNRSWKDLVFYQVANGFQPGGSGSCGTGTCLTINGSGAYHAAVIVAGRALSGQSPRNVTASPPGTYLEAGNAHSGATPPVSFVTYRPDDAANYSTVNDLVLCLDGKVNCL